MRRELYTIGDASLATVGAFEWSDLLNPANLITDARQEYPWLWTLLGPSPPKPAPLPAIPAWAVGGIALVVVGGLTYFVVRKKRENPRRRRRG